MLSNSAAVWNELFVYDGVGVDKLTAAGASVIGQKGTGRFRGLGRRKGAWVDRQIRAALLHGHRKNGTTFSVAGAIGAVGTNGDTSRMTRQPAAALDPELTRMRAEFNEIFVANRATKKSERKLCKRLSREGADVSRDSPQLAAGTLPPVPKLKPIVPAGGSKALTRVEQLSSRFVSSQQFMVGVRKRLGLDGDRWPAELM